MLCLDLPLYKSIITVIDDFSTTYYYDIVNQLHIFMTPLYHRSLTIVANFTCLGSGRFILLPDPPAGKTATTSKHTSAHSFTAAILLIGTRLTLLTVKPFPRQLPQSIPQDQVICSGSGALSKVILSFSL